MKEVIPFNSLSEAKSQLDNGGRFYNLMTKANDGKITMPELAKAAGVYSDKQAMAIFFDMALAKIDEPSREALIKTMSVETRAAIKQSRPTHLSVHEVRNASKVNDEVVIKGEASLIESKTDFTGFIMVPIMTGTTTTFTMVPIMDQYDVYAIRDQSTDDEFIIAHARGNSKLPRSTIHCGGFVKELKQSEDPSADKLFLETLYFTPVR